MLSEPFWFYQPHEHRELVPRLSSSGTDYLRLSKRSEFSYLELLTL